MHLQELWCLDKAYYLFSYEGVRKSPTIHSLYKSTVFLKILQLLGVDNSI